MIIGNKYPPEGCVIMELKTSGFNGEFFANSVVHCIEQAIKAEHEWNYKLWMNFLINDLRMCLHYARKEGKL